MTRYLLLLAGVAALFLAAFVVAGALVPALGDGALPWLARPGLLAAVAGVGLLVADVLLPVPSSAVMIAHGALFGVVLGAGLSLVGAVGATLVGYAVGRRAGPPVLRRVCSQAERARADRLVLRWGVLAVAATRPVPLLAETVALAAGASSLGLVRCLVAGTAGAAPGAVVYAVAGDRGVDGGSGAIVFVLVLLLAAALRALPLRAARSDSGT